MMNHEECVEYLEIHSTLKFPENDSYVNPSELTMDWSDEYLWIVNGACYPLPDYVGDALINWHKHLNGQKED